MAQFPGHAVATPEQPAADDDSSADTRPKGQDDKILQPLCRPHGALAQGRAVCVVLHPNRDPQGFFEEGPKLQPFPTGEVWGPQDFFTIKIQHARDPDADPAQVGCGLSGRLEQPTRECKRGGPPLLSYSALLRVGFAVPRRSPAAR